MKFGHRPANGLPLAPILKDGNTESVVVILHFFILYTRHFIRFSDWEAFQYKI